MVRPGRALLILLFTAAITRASDELFRERVAPILEARCIYCHSGTRPKGGLSLVTAADLYKGGESGPVVVAKRPNDSRLLAYVSGDEPQMPQEGESLSAAEVLAIRRWIERGAEW